MSRLLDHRSLEQSPVVANSAMNRERGLRGANSYQKELGFDPVEFLAARLRAEHPVAWLDLCCGTGRALIEAAQHLTSAAAGPGVELVGIDLVGMFHPVPPAHGCLRLEEASVMDWEPEGSFDLITCIHGLHYVGDKLDAIRRASSWLKADGLFIAHLDPANLRFSGGEPAGRRLIAELRRRWIAYDPRRHLVSCAGRRELRLDCAYLGADDSAGPNFTGQAAVDSYYSCPAGPTASRRTLFR